MSAAEVCMHTMTVSFTVSFGRPCLEGLCQRTLALRAQRSNFTTNDLTADSAAVNGTTDFCRQSWHQRLRCTNSVCEARAGRQASNIKVCILMENGGNSCWSHSSHHQGARKSYHCWRGMAHDTFLWVPLPPPPVIIPTKCLGENSILEATKPVVVSHINVGFRGVSRAHNTWVKDKATTVGLKQTHFQDGVVSSMVFVKPLFVRGNESAA
ncbi:unnamed protein product [Ectocarpus sp. 12 AP-2014]